MILGFTIAVVVVCILSALVCVGAGLFGRVPGDVTVGSVALIEVLLIAQVVISIVQPLVGNPPSGDLFEFWIYLVSALFVPVGGVIWAFVDRTRWSTVVLGVVGISIGIMMYRMQVIWTVQGA